MKVSILAEIYKIRKMSNLFDLLHDRADDQYDVYNVDESAEVYDPSDYETRPLVNLDENRNDHVIKRKPPEDKVFRTFDDVLDKDKVRPEFEELKKDLNIINFEKIDTGYRPLNVYEVESND